MNDDETTRSARSTSESTNGPEIDPRAGRPNAGTRARSQVAGALIAAAVSVAAAIGALLGQGIAYRQMMAIESIAERCGR